MGRPPRPHHAHALEVLRNQLGEPGAPVGQLRRVRPHIGHRRGDRREIRAEQARQAGERAIGIERRHMLPAIRIAGDAALLHD
ncbi:MAG: hypothetical protein B7X34_02675, partial [Acidobacteriia bacterium 12-62-4]